MSILERILSVVAPHECVGCGKEGTLLCSQCQIEAIGTIPSRCYRCHAISTQFQVCSKCRKNVAMSHVWVAGEYKGCNKELIHKLKFERAKSAAMTIGEILDEFVPLLPKHTIVTFIPTTPARIRLRGYDQSKQIAKEFAYRRNLFLQELLTRSVATRQVGSTRKTRFEQMENAFRVTGIKQIKGQDILLIDDVMTTGATIESASKQLIKAGAKKVDVAVFAH